MYDKHHSKSFVFKEMVASPELSDVSEAKICRDVLDTGSVSFNYKLPNCAK